MRVLADESCEATMLAALCNAGCEVSAVAERCPGATDTEVIALAVNESRVLVTEDKDFGQLVFAAGHGHCGVILLRYPFPLAAKIGAQLADVVKSHGEALATAFTVVQPGRARILRSPGSS